MSAPAITCSKYERVEGSRRCRHYLTNGACARPDELMCVEWLKRNPHAGRAQTPRHVDPPAPTTATQVLAARTLTDEALDSFRELGVVVGLDTGEVGPVWIVPEYTSQDRRELRVDHAATLAALCSTFVGARIISFERGSGEEADR